LVRLAEGAANESRRFLNAPDFIEYRIKLPRQMPTVLGMGAELKNTLCLIHGDEAFISKENGSLQDPVHLRLFHERASALLDWANCRDIAHDLHPNFAGTRFALSSGLRCHAVQHHQAHIASVLAEHCCEEPVLGLALDGYGMGSDGGAWGGELLLVHADRIQRLGHLFPLPQVGGDKAAVEPWRMGAAALWAMGRGGEIEKRFSAFEGAGHLALLMDKGINAPLTSSAGRLFDAACGLLNVKPVASFAGEAPMALEALVAETKIDKNGWCIEADPKTGMLILDFRPLLEKLLDCLQKEGAALFHGTLAAGLEDFVARAMEKTGLRCLAWAGGCFFNKILREDLRGRMMAREIGILEPLKLSVGDPALSLGQAWVAALRIEKERMA